MSFQFDRDWDLSCFCWNCCTISIQQTINAYFTKDNRTALLSSYFVDRISPSTPAAKGKEQLNGLTDNPHLMECSMSSKHTLEDRDKIFIE